jgi:hypothetical protein
MTLWRMVDHYDELGIGFARVDVEADLIPSRDGPPEIEDVRVLRVLPMDGSCLTEPVTQEALTAIRAWAEERIERAYGLAEQDGDEPAAEVIPDGDLEERIGVEGDQ